MDIESLLFRAASEPLGPFSMSYEAASPETWALTVTADGVTRRILAAPEPHTGGLVLSCPVEAGTSAGPWVFTVSTAPDGKKEQRIWLHGDGLSTALLVGALAELTRAAAADKPEPKPLLEPVHIPIPAPAPPPDPVPVERPRPLDWQTFSPPPVITTETSEKDSGATVTPEPVTPASNAPAETLESAAPVASGSAAAAEPLVSAAKEVEIRPEPQEATWAPGLTADETEPEPLPATKEKVESAPALAPVTQGEQPDAADVPRVAGTPGNCFECGSPYAADHAFCTNCGARLIAAGSN